MSASDFALAHTYRGAPIEELLPVPATILASLDAHARARGDDPFLTAISADGKSETLSYGELDLFSRRLGGWLRHELQLAPQDTIALIPLNDAASVVAIFGVLRAGCALLLLSPADPPARLREQIKALNAKAVLRSPGFASDVLSEALAVPLGSSLPDDFANDADAPIEPLSDALFFGTSGSTAASKLVAQSHYNAAVNAYAVCRHHSLVRGDRLLGCLPIHHVNGLHFTLFATAAAGAHVILAHAFDPFSYPKILEAYKPRIASVVPSVLEALLGAWRRPALPAGFDYFVSAAAPLSARTAQTVSRKMGVRILQGYGLTETTNFSTTMPADVTAELYDRMIASAEIPSIGTEFYGNEVAVLRTNGEHAAAGETGEICMRGHNVMMRYAGNEAATREAFRGGWFHSQDLGHETYDEASGRTFFVITGRTKNIAKVAGETVSLDEMERFLRRLPQIEDAACATLPHRFLGEEIVAAVVAPQGADDAQLRLELRSAFSAAALPRRILRLKAIPRTPTGKIRRVELASELAALIQEEESS